MSLCADAVLLQFCVLHKFLKVFSNSIIFALDLSFNILLAFVLFRLVPKHLIVQLL